MTLSSRNRNVIDEFHRGSYSVVKDMYDEFYAPLVDFATQLITNNAEAHHIAQETFLKLFQMRDRFDKLPDIKAFLYITVRNICFAYLRAEKVNEPGSETTWYAQSLIATASFEDGALREEALGKMTGLVSELPEPEQPVFRALFFDRLTIPEAAAKLRLTPVVVGQTRISAISMLREQLVTGGLFSVPLFIYFVAVFCGEQTK
jgi:RNA polymerase sigma factor (sigma-70 family)